VQTSLLRRGTRLGLIPLVTVVLFALPSCGKNTSALGSASTLLPEDTAAYVTLLQTDSSSQSELVKVVNASNDKKDHADNFEEAKAVVVKSTFVSKKKKSTVNDITPWLGDEIASASIKNPNHSSGSSSYGSLTGSSPSVNDYETELTVDLLEAKSNSAADDFLSSFTSDGEFDDGSLVSEARRIGNTVVVVRNFADCGYQPQSLSDNYPNKSNPRTVCTNAKVQEAADKVFSVMTDAKSGKSLSDNTAFVEAMKNTDPNAIARGYINPEAYATDATAKAYYKCVYSTAGATYPEPLSFGISAKSGKIDFDMVLKGADKLPQGSLSDIEKLPKETIGAWGVYDLPQALKDVVKCAQGSDNREVNQTAAALNSALSLYLSNIGNQMTVVYAAIDGNLQYGGLIDVNNEASAKAQMKSLVDLVTGEFMSDTAGVTIKKNDDDTYSFYEPSVGVCKKLSNVQTSLDSNDTVTSETTSTLATGDTATESYDSASTYDDSTCNASELTASEPVAIFGITNGHVVIASSRALYDKLASPDANNTWGESASASKIIADAKEPSFSFGAVDIKALMKAEPFFCSDTKDKVKLEFG